MSETTPKVDKKKYRTVYLRKRKMLSAKDFDRMNARLLLHFHSFLQNHNVLLIHSFLSIDKNKEVNTWPLIESLKNQGKQIVISKSSMTSNELTHYLFEDYKQLKENKYHIPEPEYGTLVSPTALEMVLIPLIVFDRKGHRLGYGAGYYDRFLADCAPHCLKVGLSLAPPLDEIPFAEAHDIPMDFCITPIGVYAFKS
ncbi:5-formyltetrahydrofolate cyclo-ligase [Reichenbachiella carrageenanivorans]|uniref:5-formyltetrahydrofolate cyclo-ligase n=1 Tax=Reichenbachiella carrageenanivorans TaxID=2979869 RepID=A0ABY6D4K2_9BACT|nr:5-formyltetrahydrofolate cyclo-ligase [Reichenbachiella carrageenanivorans]UXX80734.1 5-formyltetrahydrofolate cyclo-ligase [Reichenbachiella carrageenanivorans]